NPAPQTSPRKIEPDLAVALGIVAPVLTHLHEQEKMHRLLEDLADLLARRLADGADRLALVAKDNLLLTVTLDIDHLLYAHRAILLLCPAIRLDMRRIRTLLMQPQVALLAGDLGSELAHRQIGNLVFGIVPGALGQAPCEEVQQV